MLYFPFYSLPDSQTNVHGGNTGLKPLQLDHLQQYSGNIPINNTSSLSSFVELPPLNYLSPTPEGVHHFLQQSKQCSPGFDFTCLATPSPTLKSSEVGLAVPLFPWSKLDLSPCSQNLPPSTHTFTATLPPPPSQLAKCCSPWDWMEGGWPYPQDVYNNPCCSSTSTRRWSQPSPLLGFMDQKNQTLTLDTQFPTLNANQRSTMGYPHSTTSPENNQNRIPQRSYSMGAYSLMKPPKPQLQLADYLARSFAELPPNISSAVKQPTIEEEDRHLPSTWSLRPNSFEVSSSVFEFNPAAKEAKKSSSALSCCEFSCIPSTSAQLPSSSGGFNSNGEETKETEKYSGLNSGIACDEGIYSPSPDVIRGSPSKLSLASTLPAIQDQHSTNSSFDSFFEASPREDMLIEHLRPSCYQKLNMESETEVLKSPVSLLISLSELPNNCRKRNKNNIYGENENDSTVTMDQDQRELHKMPRLMPETTPPVVKDMDDVENTAPPPMLDPFDSPASLPQLCIPTSDATISMQSSEAMFPGPPSLAQSSRSSSPSTSGVSSANSSITFSTPCKADQMSATFSQTPLAKPSISNLSCQAQPAHERRQKYASERRRTSPPKHKSSVEVLVPTENTDEKMFPKTENETTKEKVQPFLIKLKLNRSEKNSHKEKKVPPMRLYLPKNHSNECEKKAKEKKRPLKTSSLLASATKRKKNRKPECSKRDPDTLFMTSKCSISSSKREDKKKSRKSQDSGLIKHKKKRLFSTGQTLFKKKNELNIVSNWRPIGIGFSQLIRIANDNSPVHRHCFHSIRHWAEKEEVIRVKDCVKICSSEGLENIGRIMHLHYDESSKGLMATVLWFYTHMQVDTSKGLSTTEMLDKELLASCHIDTVNVDCIESLAFVLTVNEFCRFAAETKIDQLPVQRRPSEASELWSRGEESYPRRSLLPHEDTPLELVYFCRGVYSLKTKRLSLSLPSASICHKQPQQQQ